MCIYNYAGDGGDRCMCGCGGGGGWGGGGAHAHDANTNRKERLNSGQQDDLYNRLIVLSRFGLAVRR